MLNYYRANFAAFVRQSEPARIKTPTLIIWAEEDATLGVELTEGYAVCRRLHAAAAARRVPLGAARSARPTERCIGRMAHRAPDRARRLILNILSIPARFNGGTLPNFSRTALCRTAATTLLVLAHGLHLDAFPSAHVAREQDRVQPSLAAPSHLAALSMRHQQAASQGSRGYRLLREAPDRAPRDVSARRPESPHVTSRHVQAACAIAGWSQARPPVLVRQSLSLPARSLWRPSHPPTALPSSIFGYCDPARHSIRSQGSRRL